MFFFFIFGIVIMLFIVGLAIHTSRIGIEVENLIIKVMDRVDTSGTNTKYYKDLFSKLSDTQFMNWMKKEYPIFIYEECVLYDTICFSGGKIGLQIEMNPMDLIELRHIKCVDCVKA